jgi:flagellar biosynthetic protein FlhB
MIMADDFGDKTEAPTPRRRQEAREQGNIARSPDLTTAVLLLAVIFMLNWYGPGLVGALRTLMEYMLGDAIGDTGMGSATVGLMLALRLVARSMAPLLIGVMVVAILINLAQVGLFFSFKRIQPQIAALNPFKGIGKLFNGRDNMVHLLMNLMKLFLIGFVAYSAVHNKLPFILSAQNLTFVQIFSLGTAVVYSIGLRIGMILLVLAIVDYGWQKWRTEQQLKMSKQEIKDEMRRMDGDPQIKSRRRQMAMQRIKQSLQKSVPTADVIVTNPTHFAVALKYDADTMNAPKVVAKGSDFLAQVIREIAIANGIPILERPPLARQLYKFCEIGQEIPEDLYGVVAEILAYVYEVSGRLRKPQPRQPQPA